MWVGGIPGTCQVSGHIAPLLVVCRSSQLCSESDLKNTEAQEPGEQESKLQHGGVARGANAKLEKLKIVIVKCYFP